MAPAALPTRTFTDATYIAKFPCRPRRKVYPNASPLNVANEPLYLGNDTWQIRVITVREDPIEQHEIAASLVAFGCWTQEELDGVEFTLIHQRVGFSSRMAEPKWMPGYNGGGPNKSSSLDNLVDGWDEVVHGAGMRVVRDSYHYNDGVCHVSLGAGMHVGREMESAVQAFAVLRQHTD